MPLEEPASSDTKIMIKAIAIPVLTPATANGSEAGKINFSHFLKGDFVSVEAARK